MRFNGCLTTAHALRRNAMAWAFGLIMLGGLSSSHATPEENGVTAAIEELQHAELGAWVVQREGAMLTAELRLGEWPAGRYCLSELPRTLIEQSTRELSLILQAVEKHGDSHSLVPRITITGVSDREQVKRSLSRLRAGCPELTFPTAEVSSMANAHARLAMLRALTTWTLLARGWYRVWGYVPEPVPLSPMKESKHGLPMHGQALLFAEREQAPTAPPSRHALVRVSFIHGSREPLPQNGEPLEAKPGPQSSPPTRNQAPSAPTLTLSEPARPITITILPAVLFSGPMPSETSSSGRRWRPPVALVLGGLGICGIIAGSYSLYVAGQRRSASAMEAYVREADYLKDQADRNETLGTWTLAPGISLAVGAGGLLLWELFDRRRARR